jgi:hypothetical protein
MLVATVEGETSGVPLVGLATVVPGVGVDGVEGRGLVEAVVERVEQRVVQAAPARTLVRPLPKTFQARPTRGSGRKRRGCGEGVGEAGGGVVLMTPLVKV